MDDALRDVAIPSIEFPLVHPVTDGALSPLVRTNRDTSSYQSNKRNFSVMESRVVRPAPAKKRQQTITAFHPTTKSGNHHHASLQSPLEALLQKGRAANKTHSTNRSATQAGLSNDHQPERQYREEARRKAAAAAQHRQKLASIKEQIFPDNRRQRSKDSGAEQEAWNDRALATNKSTFDPARRATLPGAAAPHPRPPEPAKPVKPKSHTTKQPQSILKKLGEDAKRSRERQAREKKALNERMRAAEEDLAEDIQAQREAEENHATAQPKPYRSIRASTVHNTTNEDAKPQTAPDDDGELILEASTPHPQLLPAHAQEQDIDQPQGPFSLNSAAGLQAIKKTIPRPMVLPYDDVPAKTATQRFMGSNTATTATTATKTPFKKALKANPDLLPITKLDLQLYKWRAEKVSWAEVRELYREMTDASPPCEEKLRSRLRQVEKAIDVEEITTEMCQKVIDGDEPAAAELNRLVALYSQTPANATPAPFKKIGKPESVRRAPSSVPPAPAPLAPRPTQGGKSLDYEAYMSLLSSAAEVYAASSDDDDEIRDLLQGSPPAEEDCVHWEYFMQRRDLTSENLEDDYADLDAETPWKEYNASFDQVGHANAEAVKFLFTAPAGVPEIFKPEEEYTLTSKRDSEGMARFDLKTEHGLVQVRVGRRMLTFQDHIMPETKQCWLSKTLFYVDVKTCKKAKDDMFEEAVVESYVLDNSVYGSLEHANSRAMGEWVKLTVKIRSVNYDEVQCKREVARRELQERFEGEGEGWAFALAVDDDERMVEVVVRALAMQGPRN